MHRSPSSTQPPSARSVCGRAFAVLLGFALFAQLCGFAQAQDPSLDRLIRHDAARLLRHTDPVVRGEAALVAAGNRDRDTLARILPLVADSQAACRHRALLALGVIGSPAAVDVLDSCLRDSGSRSGEDIVVAAFALGMAPEDVASGAVTGLLATVVQGSWKRQRDMLLALLLGVSLQGERREGAALRRLLDDESNRDPEVRALLLTLLLPVDTTLRGEGLARVLERGSDLERMATLRWLTQTEEGVDSDLLPLLERIAGRADGPGERGLAVNALARVHHVRAVELANKALRSSDAGEAAQGMMSLLSLGGARVRLALEQRLLDERDPNRLATLLQHHLAPMSAALADHCVHAAKLAQAGAEARATIAVALAHQHPARALPLLRGAFRDTAVHTQLQPLARSLVQAGSDASTLAQLLPDGATLVEQPARWCALVRAGHAEARRALLHLLTQPDSSPAALATGLAVWRRAEVLPAPAFRASALPAVLRDLLGE